MDGNKFNNEEIDKCYSDEKANSKIKRNLSREEIGCYLSHLSVHKKIVDLDIYFAIVLEDNVSFDSKLVEVVKSLLDKKRSGILRNFTIRMPVFIPGIRPN